jgi:hypothetical protein
VTARRGLGWLLALANARAGGMTLHRRAFYDLKDRLLRRFGTRDGEDVQRIVKACWGYEADGRCLGASCRRCGGSGVWEKRLIRLERWALGGRVFHRPADTVYGAAWEARVTIDGYVRHAEVPLRDSAEAALWLALLFDRRLFCAMLRSSRFLTWTWRHPLLAVQSVAFELRTGVLALLPARRGCWDCSRTFFARGAAVRCRRCARAFAATYGAPFAADDDLPF